MPASLSCNVYNLELKSLTAPPYYTHTHSTTARTVKGERDRCERHSNQARRLKTDHRQTRIMLDLRMGSLMNQSDEILGSHSLSLAKRSQSRLREAQSNQTGAKNVLQLRTMLHRVVKQALLDHRGVKIVIEMMRGRRGSRLRRNGGSSNSCSTGRRRFLRLRRRVTKHSQHSVSSMSAVTQSWRMGLISVRWTDPSCLGGSGFVGIELVAGVTLGHGDGRPVGE